MANQEFNLITIEESTIGDDVVQTVNARDLHAFLEVKSQFSHWIQRQIEFYGFTQDVDFVTIVNQNTSPPSFDFIITMDMAKILAATTKNNKGRYFLHNALKNTVLNPEELLNMLGDVDVPEADDLYVYAIRERETGRLKIGISKNPHARLKQLQTGNPNKLEIAAIREAPNRFADERAFHCEASQYKIRGEWFSSNAISVMQ